MMSPSRYGRSAVAYLYTARIVLEREPTWWLFSLPRAQQTVVKRDCTSCRPLRKSKRTPFTMTVRRAPELQAMYDARSQGYVQ